MATPLLKKLNFAGESRVAILDAPETFATELEQWSAATSADTGLAAGVRYPFVLAFVTKADQISALASRLGDVLEVGDAKVWLAYPKASSKRYQCEFNRDTGCQAIGEAGFEPVRQVAIDEDWSALRFRRAAFIKNLTRNAEWAMSAEGKARAAARIA